MREFFRGWQSKTGCLALVMASVLTIGWIRSMSHEDLFAVQLDPVRYELCSDGGILTLSTCTSRPGKWFWGTECLYYMYYKNRGFYSERLNQFQIKDEWRTLGTHFVVGHQLMHPIEHGGSSQRKKPQPLIIGDVVGAAVPYWMCVAPLTIAAAWLLLRRDRRIRWKNRVNSRAVVNPLRSSTTVSTSRSNRP